MGDKTDHITIGICFAPHGGAFSYIIPSVQVISTTGSPRHRAKILLCGRRTRIPAALARRPDRNAIAIRVTRRA